MSSDSREWLYRYPCAKIRFKDAVELGERSKVRMFVVSSNEQKFVIDGSSEKTR